MFFLSVLMSSKLNGNKIWPDTPAGPEVYRYRKILCDKEDFKEHFEMNQNCPGQQSVALEPTLWQ